MEPTDHDYELLEDALGQMRAVCRCGEELQPGNEIEAVEAAADHAADRGAIANLMRVVRYRQAVVA